MGVVSRRWMWVESMSVASGCGCIRRYIGSYPYIYILLLYLLFFATASLLFVHFLNCFLFLFMLFLCNFIIKNYC